MRVVYSCLIVLCNITIVNAQSVYREDFLELWNDYNNYFAYFDTQKADWQKVKEIYLPATDTIKDKAQFISLLEEVVNELHNGHVLLNVGLHTSNHIIPSGSDIFAEIKKGKYYIVDVRKNSNAEASGIKPGMEVLRFNDKDIESQLDKFLPKSVAEYNAAMKEYALNMLLAGTHDSQRVITININEKAKEFFPDSTVIAKHEENLLDYKILPGNIGYIKLNNSLGNYDLITAFDETLNLLKDTKSLILDLTETPSGGNTTIARAIMGRFIEKEMPYQKHVLNESEYGTVRSWIEYVVPRGKTYSKKLVIMAGHWTGSMGEGMVIGFDAMKRAKITGTKMAGLIGAIYGFSTTNTEISYQIPIERMYHVNGTPRENYLPQYLTSNANETYEKAIELAK